MADEHAHDSAGQTEHSNAMSTGTSSPSNGAARETEAGPSRPRRSTSPNTSSGMEHEPEATPKRPASPSNVLPDESSERTALQPEPAPAPAPRKIPYLDLATYPTQTLLRMLASLLQQIASANDQLRPEMTEDQEEDGMDDHASSSSGTRSRADSRASSTPNTAAGGSAASTSSTAPSGPGPAPAQVQALSNPNLNPAHPSPTTALFSDPAPTSESDSASQTQTESAGPSARPAKAPDTTPRTEYSHSPTTGRAETLFTASKTSLYHRSSLLSFHARHIPSISIEAYLLRILKYCPTTNEVFLGLLVYFDRMSRLGTPSGLGGAMKSGKGFAIDSYNVHRLVIAGVTVASKFFSDVFYTNSRYAKVGGLPPNELNQLELQFLLLNDFRLVIPYDEMQAYGNRLLGYWENKEAAEREQAKGQTGLGAPSEGQIKAAAALAQSQSQPSSKSSSSSTPTATADHGMDDQSAPRQSQTSTPTPSQSRNTDQDRPFESVPPRTASFDAAAPANGQGPPTSAITTA